jgi:hypothetical protein
MVRVGAPRSLRIAFGGRFARVGSPRSFRIAFREDWVIPDQETRKHVHATFVVARSQNIHRNMCSRSLRFGFGGRIVRVGSPCSLRIVFGGRIVRVSAPRPSQQSNTCTKQVSLHARNMRTATSFGLAALSSHRARRSHSPRRRAAN